MVRDRTGLCSTLFSASKFRWLLNDIEGARGRARRGDIAAGTDRFYLLYRLTGRGACHRCLQRLATLTDESADTGLGSGAAETLQRPENSAAEIIPRVVILGRTRAYPGCPMAYLSPGIAAINSLRFGQAGFDRGRQVHLGTGSFILMNTGQDRMHSDAGLLSTVAWQLPGQKTPVYALEGGAFICGAAVQWLRDELGIINAPGHREAGLTGTRCRRR
ncbi:MAG: hypothetical protein CM15mP103_05030 [Gammaproteobacteria bacterium]|nr:MAG: hypothetical protein CM15mP103_05030 [Gammaproteobacteria bacterium]